jgi:hypothetical protein
VKAEHNAKKNAVFLSIVEAQPNLHEDAKRRRENYNE